MKKIGIVLLGLCAAACTDARNSGAFVSVDSPNAPQLRFEGGGPYAVQMTGTATVITYRGRSIRYEDRRLLLDDRGLSVPSGTRVVKFDGADIYFDGRKVDSL